MQLDYSKLETSDFQRLAVAAVRYLLSGAQVIPYDPPQGVRDGGFDARIYATIAETEGPWRLDAKRVLSITSARSKLTELIKIHNDLPIVYVIAARITDGERHELAAIGVKHNPPVKVEVYDGAQVEQVVIAHPWLRDWFFPHPMGFLLRPTKLLQDESERGLLRSETAALEDAIKSFKAGADVVLICGPSQAEPASLLPELGRRALTLERFDECVWAQVRAHEDYAEDVKRALGESTTRTLLLVKRADSCPKLLDGATSAGLRLAIAAHQSEREELVARLHGLRVAQISLPEPTLAEVRDFAIESTVAEDVPAAERLTLWLKSPKLVAAWGRSPEIARLLIKECVDSQALAVSAWTALLSDPAWLRFPDEVVGSFGRANSTTLEQWFGGSIQSWDAALRTAEKGGLIRHYPGPPEAWLPTSEGIAVFVVQAWYQNESASAVQRQLLSLPLDILADALAALGLICRDKAPEHVRDLIMSLAPEQKLCVLRENPIAWTVHPDLMSQALDLAAGIVDDPPSALPFDLALVQQLLSRVARHPRWTAKGLGLLAAAGRADLIDEGLADLTARLLDPGRGVPFGYASEGLNWLVQQVRKRPDCVHLVMAGAALKLWLRPEISWTRVDHTSWSSGSFEWPDHPQVVRGFASTRKLLLTLLDAGDAGWSAAFAVLRDVDRGEVKGHPEQARILREVMKKLLEMAKDAELPNPRRADIEGLLNLALIHPELDEVRRPWIEAICSDVRFRLYKVVVVDGGLLSPSELLKIFDDPDKGGPQEVLAQERAWRLDEVEQRLNRFVDEIVAGGLDSADIRKLLGAAEAAGSCHDPRILAAWARRSPEVFREILTASDWAEWGPLSRSLLLGVLGDAFLDDVRALLCARPQVPKGYQIELLGFLDEPAGSAKEAGLNWLELLRKATYSAPNTHILLDLARRCPAYYRNALGQWWKILLVNRVDLPAEAFDAIFRALVASENDRACLLELLGSLKHHEKKWPIVGMLREEWVLDALETLCRGEDSLSLFNPELAWLIGRLLVKRPERFWECNFEGWPNANLHYLKVQEEPIVSALRVMSDEGTRLEQLAAFDALVRHLSADTVAAEVRRLLPTSQRRINLLMAYGVASPLLDLTIETLDELVHDDFEEARRIARGISRRSGASGLGVPAVRAIAVFGDETPPARPTPEADEYAQRANELGGVVGELLTEIADLVRRDGF